MKAGTKSLDFLVRTQLTIEKIRVATQVRNTHLHKANQQDLICEQLQEMLEGVENFVDESVAEIIEIHPAFDWFSQVKGVGKENVAKVIGLIVISKAPSISSLWKFAGFSVEDGKAPRAKRGEKLSFNKQLRTMCWRLATSLCRARGKYYEFYTKEKDKYTKRFIANGFKIIPSSELPTKVEGGVKKKFEADGIISLGHVDNMAKRKMIKLFLSHLFLVWREAEGLSVSRPYSLEHGGHVHFIEPWEMVEPKARKRARKEGVLK